MCVPRTLTQRPNLDVSSCFVIVYACFGFFLFTIQCTEMTSTNLKPSQYSRLQHIAQTRYAHTDLHNLNEYVALYDIDLLI